MNGKEAIAKIRAEIEKRIREEEISIWDSHSIQAVIDDYKDLLSFIDSIPVEEPEVDFEEEIKHKIIRHKNPQGRTTWYRAIFYDEKGRVHKSPCYMCGKCSWARRAAQNWLYANIHIWCKIAHVEQRIKTEKGIPNIIQLGTEEII